MTGTATPTISPSCSTRRSGDGITSRPMRPRATRPLFVIKPADDVAEIGLGLRPALTGRGLGAASLEAGLRFAADRFGARGFALAVAAFNRRAITVYERAGFQRSGATSTRRTAPSTTSSG